MDFDEIRKTTFERLKETYTVSILSRSELVELKKHEKYVEGWKLDDILYINDENRIELTLYIGFTYDFPLVLPDIYLSLCVGKIKYIPHVDSNRKICLFDNETIKVNPEDPLGIIRECLKKTKEIILDGLNDKDNSFHFNDEFLAYWENSYGTKDKVIKYLSMISAEAINSNEIDVLVLNPSVRNYKYIIHNNSLNVIKFQDYVKNRGVATSTIKAFYLGEVGDIFPPFFISNGDSISFVSTHFPDLVEHVKKFINVRDQNPKIVLFSKYINGRRLFFGWNYKIIDTNFNGFRPGILSPYEVITNLQRNQAVLRLSFDEYTNERIINRTDKIFSDNDEYEFLIAGLGSVGSNLIYYLKALNVNSFTLIDPEALSLENINRHLLGFEYINTYKVDALKIYLEDNNPLIYCEAIRDNVVKVLHETPDIINDIDYIFIAIGKYNIEEFIADNVSSGIIDRPVFIFWVEPYLLGGHIIYINPESKFKYSTLFQDGSYKYNVIDDSEYKKEENELRFKEAGCQTSYVPYGQEAIILFLSQAIKHIVVAIKSKESHNFALTWIGNKYFAEKLNIGISNYAKKFSYGDIIINNI